MGKSLLFSLIVWGSRNYRLLEICHRDPRKILRASRYSMLETRASNLDTRFSKASRIEFRVETVNLHLHGTAHKCSSFCFVLKLFLDWKVICIISLQVKIWMTVIFLHQMQRSTDLHLREIMALSKMNDIALWHTQKHPNRVVLTGSNSCSSSSHHPIENQNERNLHLR